MRGITAYGVFLLTIPFFLTSCTGLDSGESFSSSASDSSEHIYSGGGEKMVVVDPVTHQWTAYDASGNMVRSGLASAGADWCEDTQRVCHTRVGTFRVRSLGGANCKSPSFPIPTGGAAMPYCMYFNETQALHGVPDSKMGDANLSHGCVRLYTHDAAWLRYNFVEIGTKVVIKPY